MSGASSDQQEPDISFFRNNDFNCPRYSLVLFRHSFLHYSLMCWQWFQGCCCSRYVSIRSYGQCAFPYWSRGYDVFWPEITLITSIPFRHSFLHYSLMYWQWFQGCCCSRYVSIRSYGQCAFPYWSRGYDVFFGPK